VKNINIHNVNNLDFKIPLNMITVITGVSGSGKSSVMNYILNRDKNIIKIGSENIGLSSRSNVATYTKTFDLIRELFAKENNVSASLFSFNSKGACENCHGLRIYYYGYAFLRRYKRRMRNMSWKKIF